MIDDLTYDDFRTNRDKKRKPTLAKTWCPKCDRNFHGVSEKCDVCGYLLTKKNKRDRI